MKEKERGAKWNLGVSVEMSKTNWKGDMIETIHPGFKTPVLLQQHTVLLLFSHDPQKSQN